MPSQKSGGNNRPAGPSPLTKQASGAQPTRAWVVKGERLSPLKKTLNKNRKLAAKKPFPF